jgi:hypothetical protein
MGWSSGSSLMSNIVRKSSKLDISFEQMVEVYLILIESFEDRDWDCLDEVMGLDPAFDKAAKTLHPDWFDND